MTFVVASASPAGIALAADSRTIEVDGSHHRVVTDSAEKIFDVFGRIGVATYGIAVIGLKSIRGLLDEWAASADEEADVASTADSLGKFFRARLDAATPPSRGDLTRGALRGWPLGLLVVGYADDSIGHVLEVRVRDIDYEVENTAVSTATPSTLYRGDTAVARRLIRGLPLTAAMERTLDENTRKRLAANEYVLIPPVTAQDAVDFAFFLVQTTVLMQRFSNGTYTSPRAVPTCGGPIQGLVVTHRGVRWLQRPGIVVPETGDVAREQDD